MKSFLDLTREVIETGSWQQNRTGIRTKFIPGGMLKFDLTKGFPIITTRKAPWRSSVAEMIGFLRGYTNAKDFESLGCKFWGANANENKTWLSSRYRKGQDDLGEIYGHFWRRWVGDDGAVHDQVINALNTLHNDPTNRRIIVSGWKADAIRQGRGALPPCHIAWHLMADVERQELSLCMWQRSCDMMLGIGGGNITGYAFLLEWVARLTGYKPKWLVMHLDDVHIYENHLDGALQMLEREPKSLPVLKFDSGLAASYKHSKTEFDPYKITEINPSQVSLEGYDPHPAIKFDMAV